jgi:methyl-accepting chemotaxis protein
MLRNLKIWQKLILVSILGALPVVTLIYLYVSNRNEQIARTQTELSGLKYTQPLRVLLEHVPQHRTVANALLYGDVSLREARLNLEAQIESDVTAVDAADQQLGQSLGTTSSWDTIKVRWRDLRGRVLSLSPGESYTRHTQLINDILAHIQLVGDKSGLRTDPELDTFYLADAILVQMSYTSEYLGQLSSYGTGVAARRSMSANDEAQIRFLTRQIANQAVFLENNMKAAFGYNSKLSDTLGGALTTALSSTGYLTGVARRDLLQADKITIEPKVFYDAGTAAVDKVFRLYDQTNATMRVLFQDRINRLTEQKWTQLSLSIVLMLLALGGTLLIQRGMTVQVGSITRMFNEIGMGNFSARCDVHSNDELGRMASATNQMLDNTLSLIQSREERDRIQESIRKLLDEVSGVAAGDLRKNAEVTADVTGAIADSFNYMIAELREIISSVQKTTAEVNSSARQVHQTTESLAETSQEQSHQIVQASAAIDQMAGSIQRVSATASTAAGVASEALSSAREGATSVRKTIDGMNGIRSQVQETSKRIKRLGESSQEIGEIVQLIGDIADRTSILALNASIQAAMAGEAGKGFAVVADEVERLAERATEATKKISTLIKSVQSDTTEAVLAMEETTREVVNGSQVASEAGERLAQIEQVSHTISQLVQSISQVAQEQAVGSETVARNVVGIANVTQQTASGALEAAGSIRRLAELVSELNRSMSHFKLPHQADPEPAPVDRATVAA